MKNSKIQDIEEIGEKIKRPKKWKKVLHKIEQMRSSQTAPVDTMGVSFVPDKNIIEISPQIFHFQVLVNALLSSQTTDQKTSQAVDQLNSSLKILTIQNVIKTSESQIASLISCVGFKNKKANYLKRIAEILHNKYNDNVPDNFDDLVKLPGIGPKMAYLILMVCFDKKEGLAVDTHVYVISRRLGWVSKEDNNPEKVRKELQRWLPRENWKEFNKLIVGFGQEICSKIKPKCDQCPVSKYYSNSNSNSNSDSDSNSDSNSNSDSKIPNQKIPNQKIPNQNILK
ncbi:endonuclease iii-like protein [Anaeramoeba ignava]|uniref:Endonuclease III homolog n=1 Tax=Anaeramoeba ignava TaxID=1746090 RepID=A0A9Q0RHX0_ANAIG|nr:endonuclease iii-like protein [Anaeramoeba ignava]